MPTISAYNYLVPAAGTTNMYPIQQALTATPVVVDFRTVGLDGQQFVPSGAFIDNSQGVAPLVITVQDVNYVIQVAAGQSAAVQYPAPMNQIVSITGNNPAASIIFVDFPVLPFASTVGGGSAVGMANGADVAEGATTDAAATSDTGTASVIALLKRMLQKEGLGTLPFGATMVNAAANSVAAAAIAPSLPAVVGKTNYLANVEITAGGATAGSIVTVTITGLLGGTATYFFAVPTGAAVGATPLILDFNPPIPASAVNTAITVNVPSLGAGNVASACAIHGFNV